jgi:hypothetical protein
LCAAAILSLSKHIESRVLAPCYRLQSVASLPLTAATERDIAIFVNTAFKRRWQQLLLPLRGLLTAREIAV